MKLANVLAFLVSSGLVSSSFALDKNNSPHGRSQDRELWLFGSPETRCERQVAICEAVSGLTVLPFGQWITTLDQLSGGEEGIYSDLKELVVDLSLVDSTTVVKAENVSTATLGKTVVSLQGTLQGMSSVAAALQENAREALLQLEGLMQTAIQLISEFTGFDAVFLQQIMDLVIQMFDAVPMGPGAVFDVVIQGVMAYALPLITQVLNSTLNPGAFEATSRKKSSDDEEEEDFFGICISQLQDCQFIQFVATIMPALMSGAFVADAYAQQEAQLAAAP